MNATTNTFLTRAKLHNAIAGVIALSGLIFGIAFAAAPAIPISDQPLFASSTSQPPLNMLVVGKDHKLFNTAYNDASDLDGDGIIDVGYQGYPTRLPKPIDYYGYFDSYKCYTYSLGQFNPLVTTADKTCSGSWSGDYLNYLTTSRIDALRKVFYGGTRSTDTATSTILERAMILQDDHTSGKEYLGDKTDASTGAIVQGTGRYYDISKYTPYSAPATGTNLLFANTTLNKDITGLTTTDNVYPNPTGDPKLRVMQNAPYRIWNWVAIESQWGGQGGDGCSNSANQQVNCLTYANTATAAPPNPADAIGFAALFTTYAVPSQLCGSATALNINGTGNLFPKTSPQCDQNQFITEFKGTFTQITNATKGTYQFGVDGDDGVEATISNGGNKISSWYGGHAAAGNPNSSNAVSISFSSGDRPTITFRHQQGTGGSSYVLYWKTPSNTNWQIVPASAFSSLTITQWTDESIPSLATMIVKEYVARVQVCASVALNETNCKKYTDSLGVVSYKPTGLLHDYGENGSMLFGLLTGSYTHNHQGGVLRKNVGAFSDEVNPANGAFKWNETGFKGIISTLDGIKINDYGSDFYHHTCPSGGTAGWLPAADGQCRSWGNPVAGMMFETLRYFAGAGGGEPEYTYTDAGSDDAALNMPLAIWKNPYDTIANGGLGNLACAKPFETVVTDINTSYDGGLPGTSFSSSATYGPVSVPSGSLPSNLSALNVSTLGDSIWNNEFPGSKTIYVGESGSNVDDNPTAKVVSSFKDIRGISPEEPSKFGTYYAGSVAYYGNTHDVNVLAPGTHTQTFSVALASPLPSLDIPLTPTQHITLVPFSKSIGGCGSSPTTAFQATNQIVGFYIDKFANLGGSIDLTVNGGLPYAKFRVSYEDAEQGHDYDMDAITVYELTGNPNGSLTVTLNSEYALGCIIQHSGYVISGTTADGVYLEVRDRDTIDTTDPAYRLDTPDGYLAGQCTISGQLTPNPACPTGPSLPYTHTRTFTAGSNTAATLLKDPLWFAAKYGGFSASGPGALPVSGQWDKTKAGTPDNYFLVTNALGLKAQLQHAFDGILTAAGPAASIASSAARYVQNNTYAYEVTYTAADWTGDVGAFDLKADGTLGAAEWSANGKLPVAASRNVYTAVPSTLIGTYVGAPFSTSGIGGVSSATSLALMTGLSASYSEDDLIAYLLGDQSKEIPATAFYRKRSARIGDILNSTPAVVAKTSYGYSQLPATVNTVATGNTTYAAFVAAKSTTPKIYVGSNDGMLHAYNGAGKTSTGTLDPNGGKELFAYIPNAVISSTTKPLNLLARPGYTHKYYVDGSPTVGDAYVNSSWKELLLESTGSGARSVFALDVTDPNNFTQNNVLWEFNDKSETPTSDMGQFLGRPQLGLLPSGKWAAVFGNGLNSDNNHAVLYIRDAGTGAHIAKLDTRSGDATHPNGLATPAFLDTTGDRVGDVIYAGDYLGNVWKFEYDPSKTGNGNNGWVIGLGGAPLFTAKDGASTPNVQHITGGMDAVGNPAGGVVIIFGTGKYIDINDASPAAATTQTVYGIWDGNAALATTALVLVSGRIDLQQQSFTGITNGYLSSTQKPVDYRTSVNPTGKLGWYLDLSFSSGPDLLQADRVITAPAVILGTALINTFMPTGSVCVPGGQNSLLELDAVTGSASFSEVPPSSGAYTSPPKGASGTVIGTGSPQGDPSPVVNMQDGGGVPAINCKPGDPGCTSPPFPCTIQGIGGDPPGCDPTLTPVATDVCKWVLPNSANKAIQKPISCGRVSWRQLR